VKHIQSHEQAPDGILVEDVAWWPLKDFLSSDAILCRNTQPLIETAFLLIRNKISCRVLGREIGQGLISLVKKMKASSIIDLIGKLAKHRQRELARAQAQGKEDRIAILDDKLETLAVFINEAGRVSVDTLIGQILALFDDDGQGRQSITLATVHKSKGLEWDRVFILDAHKLMPSKWARQPWQRQQEINLQYVAITRARRELYYVSSDALRREACPNLPSEPLSTPKQIGNSPSAPLLETTPTPSISTDGSEVD
jgi:superfamily I DNA/RNA helicase